MDRPCCWCPRNLFRALLGAKVTERFLIPACDAGPSIAGKLFARTMCGDRQAIRMTELINSGGPMKILNELETRARGSILTVTIYHAFNFVAGLGRRRVWIVVGWDADHLTYLLKLEVRTWLCVRSWHFPCAVLIIFQPDLRRTLPIGLTAVQHDARAT